MSDRYSPQTKFLGRYFHRGAWFTFEFYADSWADAEDICRAHNLQLDGEHIVTIPAVSGSWLPDLIIKLRNALRGV